MFILNVQITFFTRENKTFILIFLQFIKILASEEKTSLLNV